MMKNSIKSAIAAAILTAITGCASGPVEDKQAPGTPGSKTFMVQVDKRWITVTDQEWDRCDITETWPDCITSTED